MRSLAVVIMVLAQAATSPAPFPQPQPVPQELTGVFVKILRQVRAFSAESGRVLDPNLKGVTEPGAAAPAWAVEFAYRDKGTARTAVALFIDIPGLAKAQGATEEAIAKQVSVREGRWGLAGLVDNKTLVAWSEEMKSAQRAGNEASALGDIRGVMSGQEIFKYASGGSYGELECLAAPARCLPGSKESPMIDLARITGEKAGYRRTFHPGTRVPAKGSAPSGLLRTWAITAIPLSADSGRRAFCGDSTGKICAVEGPAMSAVTGGACSKECQPIK